MADRHVTMTSGATHAGGVVYRVRDGVLEFLLVTASRNRDHWLFPKGHIDEGETAERAAAREVREESGVVAAIERPLGRMTITVRGREQRIDYFLMLGISEGPADESRDVCWLPLDAALAHLSFDNLRDLLRRAAPAR